MKGLILTQKEQGRLQTLNRVLEGWMGVGEAAYVLRLGERHTWRILAAYRKHGAKALSHGNRLGTRIKVCFAHQVVLP